MERDTDRAANDSEVEVLRSLFQSFSGTEEERIRRSGLPRTTYLSAKRRIYDRGWVRDSYLPNPHLFGRPWASFLLAQPFADDFRTIATTLANDPGTVVAWLGRTTIFAVQFHGSRDLARRAIDPFRRRLAHRMIELTVELSPASVPCYFDFEGIWAHLSGRAGATGYPRPLAPPLPTGLLGGPPGQREQESAARLVRRTVFPEGTNRPSHLLGPHNLARSESRLIRKGLVQWRIFPVFPGFPYHSATRARDMLFVHGVPRGESVHSSLLPLLNFEGHSYPFLFVSSGKELLLAGLGSGSPSVSPGSPDGAARTSVGSILQGALQDIEVIREPLDSITVTVDHRYDRIALPK